MRRYGPLHAKIRAQYAPSVAAGHEICTEPICLMPGRRIPPGTPWDLAHNRSTGGYRGPAHARCNRAEGARFGNRLRARRLPAW